MAIRWVINPVVDVLESWLDDETGEPGSAEFRAPKVRTLINPATGRHYGHSSAIGPGNWALSFVRATDFTPITADPQCFDVLQRDYEDAENFLARTQRLEGWSAAKRTRLANAITSRGGDITDLDRDVALWQWVQRLGRIAMPTFTPLGTWVR